MPKKPQTRSPDKLPSLSPGPPSTEDLPPITKRSGRPRGVKEKLPRAKRKTATPETIAKKLNLGKGMVPQPLQTVFNCMAQTERLAQYWLARANEEENRRVSADPKFNENRLNFALIRAQSALRDLMPYRHPRVTKMPEPLELSRLNKEELTTFRALFIKAMTAPPPSIEQEARDDDH